MKIYTKTGDDGSTSLFDGARVLKDHHRVIAYGDVDELNSLLGLVVSTLPSSEKELKDILQSIQKNLFALGAQLANPSHKKQKVKADFDESKVTFLENKIDEFEAELPPMTHFILPGGSPAASLLHLARTVCRRAERQVVALQQRETLPKLLEIYINRLSDFLFVMARLVNKRAGVGDIPW